MDSATKQFRKRSAILDCLRNSKSHPSAEAIYNQLKQSDSDISLATVYRNLSRFKEQGLIISLGTVGGIERFDGCIEPHVHFACSCCGAVIDVPEVEVPQSVTQAAENALCSRVNSVQLMLTGTCRECLPTMAQ